MSDGSPSADPAVATLYYSVGQVATALGISEDTVYVHMRDQVLPSTRVGKLWKIPRVALDLLPPAGSFTIAPTMAYVSGFATCARDRVTYGDCEGYASRPAALIRQVIVKTGYECGAAADSPLGGKIEASWETLHPVDPLDRYCRACGSPANLSEQARPTYPRSHERGPDAILEVLGAQRQGALVQERQAAALERLAANAQENAKVTQLEALIIRMGEQIATLQNGHGDVDEPAPVEPDEAA